MVHRLTRQQARRIAVRAQLLDAERPTDLLDVVRRLWVVQVDLTAAVAPSADLVLWSRLGPAYRLGDLDDPARRPRRRSSTTAWCTPPTTWRCSAPTCATGRAAPRCASGRRTPPTGSTPTPPAAPTSSQLLRDEGPLPARELPDTCVLPWRSSGWNSGKNVLMLLHCLERRGEVAVSSREGRERLWDLAERVLPDVARRALARGRGRARPPPAGLARHRARPRHRDHGRAQRRGGCRGAGGRRGRAGHLAGRPGAARGAGPAVPRVGPRCSRRSTGWCSTASG